MKELDKGGRGPTSGCCAIEEEEEDFILWHIGPLIIGYSVSKDDF
jgi:hypothetical protein